MPDSLDYLAAIEAFAEADDCPRVEDAAQNPRCVEIAERFGKTPAQTIELLRALPELHALERPLLLAVSRKDFVGALTGRRPATNRVTAPMTSSDARPRDPPGGGQR